MLPLKKTRISALIFGTVLTVSGLAAVDAPYEVGTWGNFCKGAISHTFDDNMNTNPSGKGQTVFDDKKFHITLCVQTNSANWSNCKASFAKGHEISSHTTDHNTSTQSAEASWKAIRQNVPGEKCVTIAYPNCNQNGSNILQYYLAGRNCQGQVNSKTPGKWDNVDSKMFGAGQCGCPNDANSMNSYADQAAQQNGWAIYTHHGVSGENHSWAVTSVDALQGHVDYLDKNRDKIWIETFGNVARYIKERDAASVTKKDSTDKGITVSVTDNLPDSTFDYPLSIRRPLPDGWSEVAVTQGGKDIQDTIITVDSKKYIMFQAVPDGGDVLISTGAVGVTGKAVQYGAHSAPVRLQHATLTINRDLFTGKEVTVMLFNLNGKVIARHTLGIDQDQVNLRHNNVGKSAYITKISDGIKTYSGILMPQM